MAQPVQKVTFKDDEEKKQVEQLANHLTAATQTYVHPTSVTPVVNQHPMPQLQVDQDENEKEEEFRDKESDLEIVDVLKGLQGKPRTAPAADFLKEKMKWLSRKNKGAEVKLK